MKRLPEIVTIFCITAGLLTSGTIDKKSVKYLKYEIENDTTGYIDLLKVDSFKLAVIPPSSGVRFYRDGIVFLSNSKNEGKMLPEHISFGSIEAYMAQVKDTVVGSHSIFSPSSPFSYPCEAITFSPDFKTMYYTRIPKKDKREKIYHAVFKPGDKNQFGWESDINPLDFCKGNFTYTHPALSSDGKLMVFASDKDGTLGKMDLFLTRKEGDKWSMPVNLGKSINTKGNEFFPFLDSEDNLFFSSDGLAGYGGYDIFTCKFNGSAWEKPVNLTHRVNTEEDDIAFSINKIDGKTGFFTTRQKSSKSEMQLFKVTLKKEIVDNNPLTISYIFNGESSLKTGLTANNNMDSVKPVVSVNAKTETAAGNKEKVKTEEKKSSAATAPKEKPSGGKVVIIKPTDVLPEELQDVVIYRVQVLSSSKQRKENQMIVNGETYKTYEYFYLNLYRYTIGEFKALAPASALQTICRKSGYPDAFVAAFKNNTRSLDLKSFK